MVIFPCHPSHIHIVYNMITRFHIKTMIENLNIQEKEQPK